MRYGYSLRHHRGFTPHGLLTTNFSLLTDFTPHFYLTSLNLITLKTKQPWLSTYLFPAKILLRKSLLTTRVLHALQQDALGVEHWESEGVARTSIGDLEYRVQSTTRGRLQITDYRLQITVYNYLAGWFFAWDFILLFFCLIVWKTNKDARVLRPYLSSGWMTVNESFPHGYAPAGH